MSQNNKILVVEDNDFVRMQIVRYLEETGHEVLEATDGIKAQEILTPQVSLIILDVRMVPMDGFEFIKAIRGRQQIYQSSW